MDKDGNWSYTLDKTVGNAVGEDEVVKEFTYTAKDKFGNTTTGTITITVMDDSPQAEDDEGEVRAGESVTGDVIGNDQSGADGWAKDVVVNAGEYQGEHGTLTLNSNGSYTYVAKPNTSGTDTFTYTVEDGDGDQATADLVITIEGHGYEGMDATGKVEERHLPEGSDPDTDALTVEGDLELAEGLTVDVPAEGWSDEHGTFEMDKDGNWSYTLDKTVGNAVGEDEVVKEFTYTAKDKFGNTTTGTITITVMDDSPQAEDDEGEVRAGETISGDVTDNDKSGADDWAKDGAVVGITGGEVGKPIETEKGTLTLSADGSYTYVAKPNTSGTDTFTYTVQDGDGDQVSATLTITIDEAIAPEETTVTVDEAGIDDTERAPVSIDGYTIIEGGSGEYGEIKEVDGQWVYELNKTFDHTVQGDDTATGADTVAITVRDGHGNTFETTVSVSIIDDVPTASDDTFEQSAENTAVEGEVLANDAFGADGRHESTPVTLVPESLTGKGELTLNNDGSFTYTPADSEEGEVTFDYTITDADGDTSTATVTITLQADSKPEIAIAGDNQVNESGLTGGTTEGEGHTTTGTLTVNTGNDGLGTVIIGGEDVTDGGEVTTDKGKLVITKEADGQYSYVYTLNETTTKGEDDKDAFTVEVTDSDEDPATAELIINIIDDKPIANDDADEVRAGESVTGDVIGNDQSGADGWAKDVVVNAGEYQGEHGTLTLNSNGSYTYVAKPNTSGTDTFTYTVEDGDGDQDTADLVITIEGHGYEGVDAEGTVEEKHLFDGSDPTEEELTVEGKLDLDDSLTVDIPTDDSWSDDHGTFVINPDGTWSYTLDSTVDNAPGADEVVKEFTYTARDENDNTVTGTITITIVDDVPAPEADTGEVESGKTLEVDATEGVLKNDKPGADGWAKGTPAVIGVIAGEKAEGFTSTGNVGTTITGAHGTLTLRADGSYTYVAKPNTDGKTDVFTYTIEDGDGDRVSTTLTIEIGAVTPDLEAIPAGTVHEAHLENGSDPQEGGAQTSGKLPQPEGGSIPVQEGNGTYGTFEIDEDGNYTYTLTEAPTVDGEDTTDTFTYEYIDKHGNTVENTVTITIVDDAPEAVADEATVSVGKIVSGNVTDNDISGADGWADEVVVNADTIQGEHGTLELDANGEYTYTPNAEAKNGDVDEFTYTVVDADGDESIATLTITIVDEQDPVANDDSYTTEEGEIVTGNVLENDKNPDGDDDDLKVVEVIVGGEPYEPGVEIPIAEGSITIDEDGNFTFTPEDGFSGEVKTPIEYKVVGEDEKTDTAKITITVTPDPIPPVAVPDSNVITEGEKATGNILDNDYDPDGDDKDLVVTEITVNGQKTPVDGETEVDIPGAGTLVITPDGNYTFTPNDDYTGNVPPIEYEIEDPQGKKDTSELLITVIPDPHAGKNPIANPDYAVTEQDTKVSGNIVGNDSSLSGGKLTVSQATVVVDGETITLTIGKNTDIPGVGKINIKKDGSYTFTPDKGFTGDVPTIDYEVVDSKGGKASSTLDIEVTPVAKEPEVPVNQPPVARPDKDVIKEGETATGNILTNDNDPDEDDSITVTDITVEGNTYEPGEEIVIEDVGTITIDKNGNYTFTPDEEFVGDIPTIDYTITDKDGLTDRSTLDIEVVPADPVNNLPPVANPDFDKIPQGSTSTGNVIDNDKDPEGKDLTVTEITVNGVTYPLGEEGSVTVETPEGEITVNKNGDYTFTPDKDFVGDIPTIGYQITDGEGGYETSTLDITVTPVEPVIPTGPVAKDDYAVTQVDTPVSDNILGNDSQGVTITEINGQPVEFGKPIEVENGTIIVEEDGSYTFTPDDGFDGEVPGIEYTVTNDSDETDTATLHITVVPEEIEVPEDDTVLAVPDVKTTEMNKKATGNILTNDITTGEVTITEIDGKTFEDGKVTIEFEGKGVITIDEKGNYTFTPEDGYVGKVPTINYTITDDNGESSSTLTITVLPKSEPEPKPEPPRPDPQPEPEPEPETPEPEPEPETPEPEPEPETPEPEPEVDPETPTPERPEPEQPELKPQDDLNHVDYNPVEVPTKPFDPGITEPSHRPLQEKNTLLDNQVQDPSVFFEGSISDKIQRMQVPLHPIVYVNRQVQEAQAERALNDVASFSNPSAVTPGEIGSISIGAGLGQDQNIFVVHAVRGTQEQAENLELQVSGRLSRVSLSSDGKLATPGLFSDNTGVDVDVDTETPADTDAEVDGDAAMDVEAPEQEGALSFSQQLQNSREFVVDMPLFVMAELD